MDLSEYLPFWKTLSPEQRRLLEENAALRTVPAGTLLHNGDADCVGLLLVERGRLRAFILSEEGREVTLFRLLERDLCLFSASCMMRGVQFDVSVESECESTYYAIPAERYHQVMTQSAAAANFTNEIMASRFSEVMWLVEQILNRHMDGRLAGLLVEESRLTGGGELKITHDKLARHLGSAREVVTRTLRFLQSEGLIQLSRGSLRILDMAGLERLAGDSAR